MKTSYKRIDETAQIIAPYVRSRREPGECIDPPVIRAAIADAVRDGKTPSRLVSERSLELCSEYLERYV